MFLATNYSRFRTEFHVTGKGIFILFYLH